MKVGGIPRTVKTASTRRGLKEARVVLLTTTSSPTVRESETAEWFAGSFGGEEVGAPEQQQQQQTQKQQQQWQEQQRYQQQPQ